MDGWIVRLSGGVTQRANSVLPLAAPADLEAAATKVEGLYRDRGLLPRFQVSPTAQPPDLDQFLVDRGYEVLGTTKVCIAAVEDLLRRFRPQWSEVDVRDEPGEDWTRLWWSTAPLRGGVSAPRPVICLIGRAAGKGSCGTGQPVGRLCP